MKSIELKIETINWNGVSASMHNKGFALVPSFLLPGDCDQLIASYHQEKFYRKTITMERYRFGLGEYKYFQYPLPGLIQTIRSRVYTKLAPIANDWMKALNTTNRFPEKFEELQAICRKNNHRSS